VSDTEQDRREGERRGSLPRPSEKLQLFIYRYWARYYRDHPEADRRKQPDRRRKPNIRTNF